MMLGAVHFGVMAACVVLFVPMGMAGWHLSRNKMLFFSGALFITLAVGVHLTPYFPSITQMLSSVSSVPVLENRGPCISFLHDVVYDVRPRPDGVVAQRRLSYNWSAAIFGYHDTSWEWVRSKPVIACDFQKLGRSDASDLLNGSWVVVGGDSQARLVVLALLSLVLDSRHVESVRADLFKRHSDYQIVINEIGMRLDFVWAPYTTNLTDLVVEYRQTKNYPDVLVMGSGLWHMLHITNASDYGASLQLLRKALQLPISSRIDSYGPLTGSVSNRLPHLFWLGMPMLLNTILNTEEKREKMTRVMQGGYARELYRSKLLRGFDGSLLLLDIHSLSQKCGIRCTVDGMHYDGAVYEASVQIMLNALLIESHQIL